MRHPFWILNSVLLFLFLIVLDFTFFSQYKVPSRRTIQPAKYVKPVPKSITEVNIEKIYTNDLFDTYVEPVPIPDVAKVPIITMPAPPSPHEVKIPRPPKPQFLEPLKVSLKGIMVTSDDETKNRAIISDQETEKETMYKVGDKIEDAKLLRIMHNKVILVRSNGQQEILYLRERDTKLDPLYATLTGWDSIAKKESDFNYIVYPQAFVTRVRSLGQFIDMLDLTTVFQQGKSIGTRVGYLSQNSLGIALGLQQGDIILSVNGMTATNTPNRIKIYRSIVSMHTDDIINVTLFREGEQENITYKLMRKKRLKTIPEVGPQEEELVVEEQIEILKQKHKVAPTASELRKKERENMRKKSLR